MAYLRVPALFQQLITFLRDVGTTSDVEAILGSWCLATQDVDKQVSSSARKSWDMLFSHAVRRSETDYIANSLALDETTTRSTLDFVKRSVFDPVAVYLELNPVQPNFVPPAHGFHGKGSRTPTVQVKVQEEDTSRSKIDEEEESEDDRKARIRAGALGVLKWFLGMLLCV